MGHRHTDKCWITYEPCGEHHAHDHNCGNGRLDPACPDYRAESDPATIERSARAQRAYIAWNRYWARHSPHPGMIWSAPFWKDLDEKSREAWRVAVDAAMER